jgi:hypothetical protein
VDYFTGKYVVCEVICSVCGTSLGIKYIESPNMENAFKIGTYLIEKPKLSIIHFDSKTKPKESDTPKLINENRKSIVSKFISLFRKNP